MNTPIISLKNVSAQFGDNLVHRDISFTVYQGESLTLLGPSGTGKTVLLKLIVGLLKPTSGTVEVFGKDLKDYDEASLSKLRQRVGMLFQGAALFDSLSVFDNVAYSLRERNIGNEEEIKHKVREKLELVGLLGKINEYPASLSGGQKKRIGLARALASEPELMLFDEPTTGLDPTSGKRIDDLVLHLNQALGITTISITHDISSARRISKRWILLADGLVQADGPVDELEVRSHAVKDFTTGEWRADV